MSGNDFEIAEWAALLVMAVVGGRVVWAIHLIHQAKEAIEKHELNRARWLLRRSDRFLSPFVEFAERKKRA